MSSLSRPKVSGGATEGPKYQLLGRLRDEEVAALEADILRRGVMVPIEVDEHGDTLDGHHRREIADRHGLPYQTIVRTFNSDQEKRAHAIMLNLARRHLEPWQWGLAFRRLLEVKGVERGQGARNDRRTSETVSEVAASLGVEARTARNRLKAADEFEALPDKYREDVLTGKKTLAQARQCVRKAGLTAAKAPPSKGRWSVEVLRRLGWSHAEIGAAIGLEEDAVGDRISSLRGSLELTRSEFAGTRQLDDTAQSHEMPLALANAIFLDGAEDDRDRTKRIGVTIRPMDTWIFNGFREMFGHDYPGRIPGDLLVNVLYFWTEQNDLVLDPMAGSGTTADACLVMDRRCYSYDVVNQYERPEIQHHDIYRDGWPPRTEEADLVFWDPPYFWKMDGRQVENGYGEKSISRLDRDEYLGFFSRAFKLAHEITKPTCKMALLMADWVDEESPGRSIQIVDYWNRLVEAGWRIDRWFEIPQGMHLPPHLYTKLVAERKLASFARYLLIASKPR